jgi:hypothetical protein
MEMILVEMGPLTGSPIQLVWLGCRSSSRRLVSLLGSIGTRFARIPDLLEGRCAQRTLPAWMRITQRWFTGFDQIADRRQKDAEATPDVCFRSTNQHEHECPTLS